MKRVFIPSLAVALIIISAMCLFNLNSLANMVRGILGYIALSSIMFLAYFAFICVKKYFYNKNYLKDLKRVPKHFNVPNFICSLIYWLKITVKVLFYTCFWGFGVFQMLYNKSNCDIAFTCFEKNNPHKNIDFQDLSSMQQITEFDCVRQIKKKRIFCEFFIAYEKGENPADAYRCIKYCPIFTSDKNLYLLFTKKEEEGYLKLADDDFVDLSNYD